MLQVVRKLAFMWEPAQGLQIKEEDKALLGNVPFAVEVRGWRLRVVIDAKRP